MVTDARLLGVMVLCSLLSVLAIFVVFRDPRATVNRLFGVSMLTIIGWIGCISLSLSSTHLIWGLLFGRFAFAFASAIPFSLLWMFEAFTDPATKHHRLTLAIAGAFCGAFVLLSLSPWVVMGWTQSSPRANFVYGPLHLFFGAYFILCFICALYTLWKKIRSASGIRSLQLRYLLLGILIGGAGAITTNLVIPLVWKTSRYSLLGPYFSLVVALFSAHAIIRYRLMDIRVVIRNGVVYACAVTVAALVFVTLAVMLGTVAGYSSGSISLSSALTLAIVMAILFHPLKGVIQNSLNRYLYRHTYDYQRTIRDASRRLSTILDLNSLLMSLAEVIENTLRAEMVCVYLRDELNDTFSRQLLRPSGRWPDVPPAQSLSKHSPLLFYFEKVGEPLVREEATLTLAHDARSDAATQLRDFGGEVAVPFLQERGIFGLLIVGPKLSGDPYFTDDIDLLSTLVSQASIALKNAQLYREVVLINEYVENIIRTMDSAVIAVSADGMVTLFNSAAQRLTGIDTKQIKGYPLRYLPNSIATLIEAALRDRRPRIQVETAVYGTTGSLTPVICSTSPLTDHSDTVFGAVAVFSDLTRVKQLEEEKRRTEQLAAIGALASGIAHEIKNPLVAIKTFAELLPERFSDTDFRNDFAQIVTKEIDRIDGLVARLRGLAVQPPRRLRPLDLRLPIEETLALLRAQFEQRKILVEATYADGLAAIEGDAGQLKQLFLNLFMNALEAMDNGGVLFVRLSPGKSLGYQSVVVEVSDTGSGIQSDLLDRIFDPFVTTKNRGSGLGLSICRGIVDTHKATIHARNNENKSGATIVVEFPVPQNAPTINGHELHD